MSAERMADLDEAVKAFTAENLGRSGVVTGWVLFVSSSRLDDDGEPLHSYDYSVGPDCDLVRAGGLVKYGTARMDRDVAAGDD